MSEPTTLGDLVVDYVRRMPVTMLNVASHFGLPIAEARGILMELEQAGRLKMRGRHMWEISQ